MQPDNEALRFIPRERIEEFEAARRGPPAVRMRYASIHTHKPVYRAWRQGNLPSWLGYGRF